MFVVEGNAIVFGEDLLALLLMLGYLLILEGVRLADAQSVIKVPGNFVVMRFLKMANDLFID